MNVWRRRRRKISATLYSVLISFLSFFTALFLTRTDFSAFVFFLAMNTSCAFCGVFSFAWDLFGCTYSRRRVILPAEMPPSLMQLHDAFSSTAGAIERLHSLPPPSVFLRAFKLQASALKKSSGSGHEALSRGSRRRKHRRDVSSSSGPLPDVAEGQSTKNASLVSLFSQCREGGERRDEEEQDGSSPHASRQRRRSSTSRERAKTSGRANEEEEEEKLEVFASSKSGSLRTPSSLLSLSLSLSQDSFCSRRAHTGEGEREKSLFSRRSVLLLLLSRIENEAHSSSSLSSRVHLLLLLLLSVCWYSSACLHSRFSVSFCSRVRSGEKEKRLTKKEKHRVSLLSGRVFSLFLSLRHQNVLACMGLWPFTFCLLADGEDCPNCTHQSLVHTRLYRSQTSWPASVIMSLPSPGLYVHVYAVSICAVFSCLFMFTSGETRQFLTASISNCLGSV